MKYKQDTAKSDYHMNDPVELKKKIQQCITRTIKFYSCSMTVLIHRLRFYRLHKCNQLYIKHLLVQPKRWGRQQSHFGTFSALQSTKRIPKVYI